MFVPGKLLWCTRVVPENTCVIRITKIQRKCVMYDCSSVFLGFLVLFKSLKCFRVVIVKRRWKQWIKPKHHRTISTERKVLKFLFSKKKKKSQLSFILFYLRSIKFFLGFRSTRPVHLIIFWLLYLEKKSQLWLGQKTLSKCVFYISVN